LVIRLQFSKANAPFKAHIYLFITLLLCWMPLSASALGGVTILISTPAAPVNEFLEQFKTEFPQNLNPKLPVKVITEEDLADNRAAIGEDDLLIAVGVQALDYASKLNAKLPVLGVLVPQPSFEKILTDSKRNPRTFSAIVLDQPFPRQIALLKAVIPSATNVGVLFGPASQPLSSDLQQAARQQGLGILQENVNSAPELMPKLRRVLEGSPVLLAVPDPAVYNRETVQTILLTSYRYQKPVIGFSQAYVRAGALAAVYSTPRQIAKQAAEVIRLIAVRTPTSLPPPQAPKYFSVDTNRQVARSLGIELDDENAISEKLSRIERQLP
jgi:putative ABC transport system substrate-binding protein